jgi:mRNA interferase MazF
MMIRRGEIWQAELREPLGSEPGYRRPVLILQSDDFTRSHIATVIAVVLTSNIKLASAPGNVFLPRKLTDLSKDSVANISQIITIDKGMLSERIGFLPQDMMRQIEAGVRLILAL